MKSIAKISAVILLALVLSFIFNKGVYAFPTPAEMESNYKRCVAYDDSWYSRFGRYVVAFDIDNATRVCSSDYQRPMRPQLASCDLEGGYVYAGYYRQEINI